MATIIVNENMKGAKEFLNFVKSLPFVKITDKTEKKPNALTRRAMKEAEQGKVEHFKTVKDIMKLIED